MSTTTTDSVGFIGLGDIGLPMASRLLACGVRLVLYNRTREKAEALASDTSAEVVASPADVAKATDVVITCLHGPAADRAVYLGPSSITAVDLTGSLCINTSTIGPDLAVELAESVFARGGGYLDCPLMGGGREAAANGSLVLPVGGDPVTLERGRPVLELLATSIEHVGGVGSAQVLKLVNNLQVGVTAVSLAQALAVAEKAGLDLSIVRRVLPLASSHSRAMDRYMEPMLNRAFSPRGSLRTLGKDVALGVQLARSNGCDVSVAEAAALVFDRAVQLGIGDLDVPALIQLSDDGHLQPEEP
jgi:3-hydroxyisobutyrate dehydrogenase-like beta-hydroxyacid dehydrogenase